MLGRLSLFFALVLCAACGEERELREWTPDDHGQPRGAAVDPARMPGGGAQSDASLVERAWAVTCAPCHGPTGHGDGRAKPPGANVPDLTTEAFQTSRSDAQIREVIANGRGMMPGIGDRVPPRGIDALVRHVRVLGAAAGGG